MQAGVMLVAPDGVLHGTSQAFLSPITSIQIRIPSLRARYPSNEKAQHVEIEFGGTRARRSIVMPYGGVGGSGRMTVMVFEPFSFPVALMV
jgi:hypothetical protein